MSLSERLEQAEGPSRELDAEIWCLLNGKRYKGAFLGYDDSTQAEFTEPPKRSRMVSKPGAVRPFTASIDAALTLVPGGEEYPDHRTYLIDCATQTSQYAQPVAYVWTDTGKHMGKGRTAALALCVAAIRARETSGE